MEDQEESEEEENEEGEGDEEGEGGAEETEEPDNKPSVLTLVMAAGHEGAQTILCKGKVKGKSVKSQIIQVSRSQAEKITKSVALSAPETVVQRILKDARHNYDLSRINLLKIQYVLGVRNRLQSSP